MFLLLSFHTKTLELYQAVCSHGNHKVANVLTQHVDERQLMHAIKSECESECSREELWWLMTSEPLCFFFFYTEVEQALAIALLFLSFMHSLLLE